MRPCPLCIMFVALFGCIPRDSDADLLWNNGEYKGSSALSSERNTIIPESWVVDDAILAGPSVITDFEWICLMSRQFTPSFADFIILGDKFQRLYELKDLSYERLFEGESFGYDLWSMSVHNLSIFLPGGRYYFGGRPVGNGDYRAFTGEKRMPLGKTEAFFQLEYFGYPDWTSVVEVKGVPFDATFKLYGEPVPEPAPILAVAGAVASLLLRRRKFVEEMQ